MASRTRAFLGVHFGPHDSAATLVRNGEELLGVEEERFWREGKHTGRFPAKAIEWCLAEAGLSPAELDAVGLTWAPRAWVSPRYLAFTARHLSVHWLLETRRRLLTELRSLSGHRWLARHGLNVPKTTRVVSVPHHQAHAASAFLVSPFPEAAILTIDGLGEWTTCEIWSGSGVALRRHATTSYPHSLGYLYGGITVHLGFRFNYDEYKVMGLASFGDPSRFRAHFREVIRVTDDGQLRVDPSILRNGDWARPFSPAWTRPFGPPRAPGAPLEDVHRDLAAALQERTEECMVRLAEIAVQKTGQRRLCLAGGVALNCVGNARILESGIVDEVFVQPASHDAGCALGAAVFLSAASAGDRGWVMDTACLGPSFDERQIEAMLLESKQKYRRIENPAEWAADRIARGRIVGWFGGRAEFGPRALGSRSILADPTSPTMQDEVNRYVKHREDFRPFAPAVVCGSAAELFELEVESPFMTLVARVREPERLPAITHIDGTARIQTVDPEVLPEFAAVLENLRSRIGVPCVLNTSFNVAGEPIVLTPRDAIRCWASTGIDDLVLGPFVLSKDDPGAPEWADRAVYARPEFVRRPANAPSSPGVSLPGRRRAT